MNLEHAKKLLHADLLCFMNRSTAVELYQTFGIGFRYKIGVGISFKD